MRWRAVMLMCSILPHHHGQKTGHLRMMKKPEHERDGYQYQPVWVLGLFLMICGEIGNLVSYGDRNTSAAVITAVGCIGVVANLVRTAQDGL